jgi:ABC-type multidrug transport system ATPase subunit/ABC-type multidrug transport system permease subunit
MNLDMAIDPSIDGVPEFIVVAAQAVTIGRSSEVTVQLADPGVSRLHATIRRIDDGLFVEDHDGRYGTSVNGDRVRVSLLRAGDLVRFGPALAYRVEAGGLRLDLEGEGLEVVASGLAIRSPEPTSWNSWTRSIGRRFGLEGPDQPSSPDPALLIDGVGFGVRPDSFVGILGPSGSGKSTLLNCLAGRRPPDRGGLAFDGGQDVFADPERYRARLGHVPQDDIVYRSLTARENLGFAGRLRLGESVTADQVETAINRVLELVDLANHANKPVAVLSGGQRKRLSVAIELLRRPGLLLLDEPTSGLDPASEAHLMERLRHLARRGTTVVCTTHLMENLALLDEVVALGVVRGVGKLAYIGPPEGLLPRFGCRGFADLYEVLASGRFEPIVEGPEPGSTLQETTTNTPSQRKRSALVATRSSPSPASDLRSPGRSALDLASVTIRTQLAVVAHRATRLVLRDRPLVAAMVAQPVVLGLLAALSQYDSTRSLPILFFSLVIATWLGLNNAARDLVRDRRHYGRDRLAGLRPASYLGGKALVQLGFGLIQVLILFLVIRSGCRFVLEPIAVRNLDEVSQIRWLASLILSYLGGVGLGLLASTLARTEEAAIAALPLLILPQLLLSGVAAGFQNEPYTRPRPFRPLVVTVLDRQPLPKAARFLDLLSMVCPSRPAVLVAEAPKVKDYGDWLWVGDLSHLLILVLATWLLLIVAFHRSERRWLAAPNLDG